MREAMTADALMSRHTAAWQAATIHPFLAGVRDGSLPEHSFDRWLAQDYLFARAPGARPVPHRGHGPPRRRRPPRGRRGRHSWGAQLV